MLIMKRLLSILAIMFLLCGCQRNASGTTGTSVDNYDTIPQSATVTGTTSIEMTITAKGRSYSIDEIHQGILKAFHTEFYYSSDDAVHLDRNLILNKKLEYDLVFVDDRYLPCVYLIVNNLEHPMSTEEAPLYSFGVAFSERGMEEKFHAHGKALKNELEYQTEERGGMYLGRYTLLIDEIVKPQHEQMSDEWKQLAETAIRRYMDKNDFYFYKEENLEPGNYHVYIKGFAEGDTNADIIFEHENGKIYQGFYYFVHDIAKDRPADLNHVDLRSKTSIQLEEWLNKIREGAALSMEYSVQE